MKKYNILIISQLYPSGLTGTSVKTRETIGYFLSRDFFIDVLCIHHKKMEKRELTGNNLQIFTVERNVVSKFSFFYMLRVFHLLITFMPFRVKKMFDKKIAMLFEVLDNNKQYDFVLFDGFSTLQYAKHYDDRYIYVDDEDITDLLLKRCKEADNLLLKAFFYLEFLRCRKYEKKYLSNISQVWAISEKTEARLKTLSDAQMFIMPTLVPAQKNIYSPSSNHIVFSGLLSWLENIQGLRWFLDHHWPAIHKRFPKIKLIVTGQMASQEFVSYLEQFPGVVYKGFVDNLSEVYRTCALAIAPIRINSGIKVKILTYLSFGLPVVSTDTATWGLSSLDGVVASSDDEFGKNVIQLLSDKRKQQDLSRAAVNNIGKNHSWNALDKFMKKTGVYK